MLKDNILHMELVLNKYMLDDIYSFIKYSITQNRIRFTSDFYYNKKVKEFASLKTCKIPTKF